MRDHIYIEELKRLLREHPFGVSIREMHELVRRYGIPAQCERNLLDHCDSYYSTELTRAFALLLKSGDIASYWDIDLSGKFFLVEVKYA